MEIVKVPAADEFQVGEGVDQAEVLEAVELLFMRLLQLSPGLRPKIAFSPGAGVEVIAAVFLGELPAILRDHLERGAKVKGQLVKAGEQAWAAANGPTGDAAIRALRDQLATGLRERIESDLAVWERAGGVPWGARARSR
jgi:hypothetical protein